MSYSMRSFAEWVPPAAAAAAGLRARRLLVSVGLGVVAVLVQVMERFRPDPMVS